MHVVIGGGSGFVGDAITQLLRARGDRVTWISREPGEHRIAWEQLRDEGLPTCDAVINLAGMHILNPKRRWNAAYREEVIRSRVETTTVLVEAINRSENAPDLFISTAGKCFYGTGEIGTVKEYPELDEDAEPMGIDFPAELVGLWEQAADGIDTSRIRHAKVRIAIVLGSVGREGFFSRLWRIGSSRGFLPIIRLPFCLGLGCVIGDGRQPFPWIHIDDCAALFVHLIDKKQLSGRFNAVAPERVSSEQLIRSFAAHLRRPILWRVPPRLVMWLVGAERASILLEGQNVVPKRTIESGFRFRYPTLDQALDDLVEVTV